MAEIELDKSKNTYTDEELKEILAQHKLWLDTNGKEGKRADLSSAVLVGIDLTGADLRGAYLAGAYLAGAYLAGAYLAGAYLTGAYLTGADLTGAYLTGADLTGAYLAGADLRGADLTGADLTGAYLRRANCENTVFINTKVHDIKIEKTNLLGARFLDIGQQELFLNHNIQEAQKALANSLENANTQVKEHNKTALETQKQAKWLLWFVLGFLLFLFFLIFGLILCGNGNFNGLLEKLGAWSLILFNFPIIITLTIATILFRHQKKLLDEVRHYSAERRQIELYSGLLEASQYIATSLNDPQKSAEYVQNTFTAIRDRLLNEPTYANTAGSAVEKEGYENVVSQVADTITKNKA